jgi:hypothetical protein
MSCAHAAAGCFTVAGVKSIDDVHSGDDPPEWRETFSVVLPVVAQVDEHLRRARSRRRERIRQRAALVRDAHRVVGDRGISPGARELRIAGNAELCERAGPSKAEGRRQKAEVLEAGQSRR